MRRAASPIREVLRNVFAQWEGRKALFKEDMDSCWKSLAGEGAFRHSRPFDLKRKVLTVRVDNSAWMQDLVMRKRQLLKGLKRKFGKDKIAEVRFRIGEF